MIQHPRQRLPRSEECYICHSSRAHFRPGFFALPRGVPVSNCFNGLLRALTKNSLEDRMSKFHLVKKWWHFEIAYFGSSTRSAPASASPMFSPIFSKVPMTAGQWNLVCVFLMATAFWRFGYYRKIREKIFPPPQLRIFCWVSQIFFKVLIVVGWWNLVYVFLIALSIWCFHYFR